MAIDKAIDSTQLDADLTAVADAIRAVDGGSDTYSLAEMSEALNDTASEITTQEGIISQIAAALSGKGSGGSLPESITKIDGGSFVFQTATSSAYHINHNLGATPKCFVIWTDGVSAQDTAMTVIRGVFVANTTIDGQVLSYLYQLGSKGGSFDVYTRSIGSNYAGYSNDTYISYNVDNNSYKANTTYNWIAWV